MGNEWGRGKEPDPFKSAKKADKKAREAKSKTRGRLARIVNTGIIRERDLRNGTNSDESKGMG